MPEFEDIREQLREARDQREAAANDVRAARERLRRIASEEAELNASLIRTTADTSRRADVCRKNAKARRP